MAAALPGWSVNAPRTRVATPAPAWVIMCASIWESPSMNTVQVPVSIGELVDKITILQIKAERIDDASKRANVQVELDGLLQIWDGIEARHPEVAAIRQRLRQVNEAMWDIQDSLRAKEAAQDFGDRFIELARAVGRTNGERVGLKNDINRLAGSIFVEEKEYKAG
jgi:hypothetical protein